MTKKRRKTKRLNAPTKPALPDSGGWTWPERTRVNLLLLAVFSAVLFRDVFLHPGQIMWANDVLRFWLPVKYAQWNMLWEQGAIPLWDPTTFCGLSVVGDQGRAFLNPLTWLHWLLPAPALFGPLAWLVATLGAWGMFLFARGNGCSALGASFAACAFALGGKTAGHLFAGHLFHVSTVLGLPWMLYVAERALKQRSFASMLLMGIVFALVLFQGAVQMFYLNLLFALAYLLIRVGFGEHGSWKQLRESLRSLACGACLGGLLGMPFWLPVFRQTLLLVARSAERDYGFATMASARPLDMIRLLWPFAGVPLPQPFKHDPELDFFWETASYPGVATLFLACMCLFTLHRQRSLICLGLLALLAILVGLGPHTPLHKLAYHLVPGFSFFRAPARLFFYSNFIMALLAGMLLSHDSSRMQRGWTTAFLLTSFLVVLMATVGLQRTSIPMERGLWVPALVLLTLGIATYLWAFQHISQNVWRQTALGLLALEIFLVWTPHVHTAPLDRALPPSPTAEFLAGQKEYPFRVLDTSGAIPQQIAAKHGLEIIAGYDPGIYGHHLDLYNKIWPEADSSIVELYQHPARDIACPVILDLMNVGYVVTREWLVGEEYEEVHLAQAPGGAPPLRTYRRLDALPRAYLVAEARTPPAAHTVLDAICGMDARRYCLVEDDQVAGGAPFQEVALDSDGASDMVASFSCGEAGMLVLSLSWHPDWRAFGRGERLPVRRVNHGQLGVPVAAGDHEIRIRYVPWDFHLGLAIAVATVGAGLIANLAQAVSRRRDFALGASD